MADFQRPLGGLLFSCWFCWEMIATSRAVLAVIPAKVTARGLSLSTFCCQGQLPACTLAPCFLLSATPLYLLVFLLCDGAARCDTSEGGGACREGVVTSLSGHAHHQTQTVLFLRDTH